MRQDENRQENPDHDNYDDYDDYGDSSNNMYDDPVKYPTEIDAQLIKSGYKKNEFKVKIPKFKTVVLGVPFKNKKTGRIKILKGRPVLKKFEKVQFFDGYEEKTFPMPIELHNDTITSSILEPHELTLVRMIDAYVTELALETVSNPDADYSTSIQLFSEIKASLVESSKGKGGRMAELSKTTINKGEQRSWDYRSDREFEEYQKRKQRKGLFGLGLGPL